MSKLITICFTFLSCCAYSQIKFDSLWTVFNDPKQTDSIRLKAIDIIAWDGYLYSQPDSAIYYSQLQYDFANKKKLKKEMALALNTQGAAYDNLGNYIKALEYYQKSLFVRQELDDQQGVAASLNNIATIYRNQGDYAQALNHFLESLKIKKELGDKKGSANSMLGIGNIYIDQEEFELAKDYFEQSLLLRQEIGDKKGIASSLLSVGNIDWIKKDYDAAIQCFNKSLTIQQEIGDKKGVANSLNNIAIIYKDKGELDKALKLFMESHNIREEIGDNLGMASSLSNIGIIFQKKGNHSKAVEYGKKSLEIARKIGAIKQLRDAYGGLYDSYKISKQFEKALEMHEQFINLKDSVLSDENHKELTQLQFQFKYEMKTTSDSIQNLEYQKVMLAENEKQKAVAAKRTAEAKVLKNQQYALFGGLGLVIVFSLFIFNRFRITKRQKKIIENQKLEVEKQKEYADEQRKIAENQKNIVEEKNREISDSINYAKRIQEAILPSRYSLIENLKNGFVFFKPKDIVSGDFYWLEVSTKFNHQTNEQEQTVYFAAADCTGHGVPGAMVSVVCSNALSKSLLEEGITEPGKLLDRTRELVIHQFAKSDEEVKDGMDISLGFLAQKKCEQTGDQYTELKWAGANNPLWIINPNRTKWPENVLLFGKDFDEQRVVGAEIKPNTQPVGNYECPVPFTTHIIRLEEGDTLYLFTDGYQDQFGGEKGKKFKSLALKKLLVSIFDKQMDEQKNILDEAFHKWKGDHEQIDDICIIGVRI
jgi:tetratricopeptide (TPR) repeat protein